MKHLNLYVPVLGSAISAIPSRESSSILNTLAEDGYSRVIPGSVICGKAERSDLRDVPRDLLLIVRLTVQNSSASSLLFARPLQAHSEVASSARERFGRALVPVLDSKRLPAGV